MCLIQPQIKRVVRNLSGTLYTVLNGKDCQLYKDNPGRGNIIEVWKDYTIEDAIIVIEKAMKATRPETMNSC